MEVLIEYFDGCQSWETARNRVAAAVEALPAEAVGTRFKVESNEEAERLGFRGSPSILVDGKDLFPTEASPIGMSCRVYLVDGKAEGAPSVEQLVEALRPFAPA